MEAEEYFKEFKVYKCITDTLVELGFHYGYDYYCPRDGQLTNNKGVNTFMSDILIKVFNSKEAYINRLGQLNATGTDKTNTKMCELINNISL